jgi:hypothetical protein
MAKKDISHIYGETPKLTFVFRPKKNTILSPNTDKALFMVRKGGTGAVLLRKILDIRENQEGVLYSAYGLTYKESLTIPPGRHKYGLTIYKNPKVEDDIFKDGSSVIIPVASALFIVIDATAKEDKTSYV